MKSLVHEDWRNQERRLKRASSVHFQQAKVEADPSALRFAAALASQDKLKKFMNLLDPWTAAALCEVHLEDEDVPRAVIARRLGMTLAAFNRRYERGLERGRAKYLRIYGSL